MPSGSNVPQEVKDAAAAINKGTATPEILQKAVEAAHKADMPETAEHLASQLDKVVTQVIPEVVKAPNKPSGYWHGSGPSATGTDIPNDPATGKTLWYPEVKSGVRMILPRFGSVMDQFKALQRACGVKDDGRIGPGTLSAFRSRAAGYPTAPTTIDGLAANAVKWTEIMTKKYQKEVVGQSPSF